MKQFLSSMQHTIALRTAALLALGAIAGAQDIAVRGRIVHTMAGDPIQNGVVLIRDGKIAAVGEQGSVPLPEGIEVREATVYDPSGSDPP